MLKWLSKLAFNLKYVKRYKQFKRQFKTSFDTSKIFNEIELEEQYSFIFKIWDQIV